MSWKFASEELSGSNYFGPVYRTAHVNLLGRSRAGPSCKNGLTNWGRDIDYPFSDFPEMNGISERLLPRVPSFAFYVLSKKGPPDSDLLPVKGNDIRASF
jgi:hypothetical protein